MQLAPFVVIGAALSLAVVQGSQGGSSALERGEALFTKDFHLEDGLGAPQMNADSCRACHRDPTVGGAGPLELNVSRFGRDNGGQGPFQNLPGGQGLSKLFPPRIYLGDSTAVTNPPEAVTLQEAGAGWEEDQWAGALVRDLATGAVSRVASNNADTLNLALPWSGGATVAVGPYRLSLAAAREEYPGGFGAGAADCFEQRQTPSLFGVGMIDQIAGAVITANEDPLDANGDGIFGIARRIDINGTIEIGRFGWKSQIPRLRDFTNDALIAEMGITTPDDGRGFALDRDDDPIADPELTTEQVTDLTLYMASLPAPQRGGSTDPRVMEGLRHFNNLGCATCHIPELPGPNGPVRLYSNLLLHNVMPPGYRGMEEQGAGNGMFRTPPLWGIKHTAPYMHDGRAEDLTGAILAHYGEADSARQGFAAMDDEQRGALLLFLEDL